MSEEPVPVLPNFNRTEVTSKLNGGFQLLPYEAYGTYLLHLTRYRFYSGFKGISMVARCVVEGLEPLKGYEEVCSNWVEGSECDLMFKMGPPSNAQNFIDIDMCGLACAVQGHVKTPEDLNAVIFEMNGKQTDVRKVDIQYEKGERMFVMVKYPSAPKEMQKKDGAGNVVIENGKAVVEMKSFSRVKFQAVTTS